MMQHARFFLVLLLVRNKAIGLADVLGPCRISVEPASFFSQVWMSFSFAGGTPVVGAGSGPGGPPI
jgi:hypothetical protein